MRIILLIVLVLSPMAPVCSSFAKDPPLTEAERNVVQVYQVPGFSRDQIHQGAKKWIAENFRSADAVLEYDDQASGTIIGNGIISINPPAEWGVYYYGVYRGDVRFKMKVESKDSRLRISFSNIRLIYKNEEQPPKKRRDMDNIKKTLLAFGDDIVKSMNSAKNEDW